MGIFEGTLASRRAVPPSVPERWFYRSSGGGCIAGGRLRMVLAAQVGCSVAARRLLAFPPRGVGPYGRRHGSAAACLSREDLQDCLLEACTAGEFYEPGAGHRAAAQLFIDLGASVERRSPAGSRRCGYSRPLHHAASHGNLGAAEALLAERMQQARAAAPDAGDAA